jgi:hypothetical protein
MSSNTSKTEPKQRTPEDELLSKMEEVMFTRGNVTKYNDLFISIIIENIKRYRERTGDNNSVENNTPTSSKYTTSNTTSSATSSATTTTKNNSTSENENITIIEKKKYNEFNIRRI